MTQRFTLLIVEDEDEIFSSLKEVLVRKQYEVQRSAKVGDAVFKCRNQKFFCVILDMKILQGTGVDVLKTFRDDPKSVNHKTPVVVTSGALDADIVDSIKGQVQGVFVKPYKMEELVEKINSFKPV